MKKRGLKLAKIRANKRIDDRHRVVTVRAHHFGLIDTEAKRSTQDKLDMKFSIGLAYRWGAIDEKTYDKAVGIER